MDGWVFISYSRDDRGYVERLAAHLRRHGIPVWYDAALRPGTTFPTELEYRIDHCAAFIVVRTPASAASTWVGDEVARAVRRDRTVLPLLLVDSEPSISLERINAEDVRGGTMPGPAYVEALRAALAAAPSPPPQPGAPPPLTVAPAPPGPVLPPTPVPQPTPAPRGARITGRPRRAPVVSVLVVLVALIAFCGYGIVYLVTHPDVLSTPQYLSQSALGMHVSMWELSPDGTTVALVGRVDADYHEGTAQHTELQLWDVTAPAAPVRLSATEVPDEYPPSWLFAFTPDGRWLVDDKGVWDLTDPKAPVRGEVAYDGWSGPAVVDRGRAIVIQNHALAIVDLRTFVDPTTAAAPIIVSATMNVSNNAVAALSVDQRRVAVAVDRNLTVWDLPDAGEPAQLGASQLPAAPTDVVFGPDHDTVLVRTDDGTQVWNLGDPTRLRLDHTFAEDAGYSCWDISVDHRIYASCGVDGVQLWALSGLDATALGDRVGNVEKAVRLGGDGFLATLGSESVTGSDGSSTYTDVLRLWRSALDPTER